VIEVLAPGILTLVQDLGRPGFAALGIGRSGAADPTSLQLGNRLVANDETAAGLEVTLGGLAVRFHAPTTFALTGAPCPATILSQAAGRNQPGSSTREASMNSPVHVDPSATLVLGTPTSGLRTYLTVRGGIAVSPVLGSRSTDVLSQIGPPVLAVGQQLPIGPPPQRWPLVDHAPIHPLPHQPVLHLLPGPRRDWFRDEALDAMCAAPYTVDPNSNRIALRLRGNTVRRAVSDEVPPEGLIPGAIQIPPDGQPVLFLADHPVTGGYPVIGVVHRADVCQTAQLRPGQTLRFAVSPGDQRRTRQ
jgi:biotin-dependent carboxylase-like uncharacterized protein